MNDEFSLNFVSLEELLDQKETKVVDLEEVLKGVKTETEVTIKTEVVKVDTPQKLVSLKSSQKNFFYLLQ